jgi:YfiH family protein
VAFSTRVGGVSTGPFASLNLGILTGDEPERVVENRRRVCAEIGAAPERATMAWQRHSALVAKADPRGIVTPGTPFERCDGLWSDDATQPMLLLTADCLPVAIARRNGSAPALALLHVGWRGLLEGIVDAGVAALRAGNLSAAIGPGIGPCCYEVGEEVAGPFRTRFGADVLHGRNLDLWTCTERALRAAGCSAVERIDLCSACREDLFFSHRRDGGVTGRQGVIGLVG